MGDTAGGGDQRGDRYPSAAWGAAEVGRREALRRGPHGGPSRSPQAGTCICPTPHIPRSPQQVCRRKRTQMPGTRALAPGAVWGNQALEGRCGRVMGVQM